MNKLRKARLRRRYQSAVNTMDYIMNAYDCGIEMIRYMSRDFVDAERTVAAIQEELLADTDFQAARKMTS